MALNLPLIFNSSSLCSKCTNYNWYSCHFHAQQLFQLSGKIQVFVYLFLFYFIFTLWSTQLAKSTSWQVFSSCKSILGSSCKSILGWDWLIHLNLKVPENFLAFILRIDSAFCIYCLSAWSNLNLLHNSQWITFPI